MSKMHINLEDASPADTGSAPLEGFSPNKGKGRAKRVLGIFTLIVIVSVLVLFVSGFFYWRHLKTTPQHTLAMLVDASRNEDNKRIDEIVDTDAVVDDFVPQITDKAVELYGRGLAPDLVKRIAVAAAPAMPFVKERARAELPKLLREKTEQFDSVPIWVLVLGADRYLNIEVAGETATISAKNKTKPLEIVMKRDNGKWRVVAVRDERLARKIAEKIGQQVIAVARSRGEETVDKLGRKIGIEGLGDLIKKAEELVK